MESGKNVDIALCGLATLRKNSTMREVGYIDDQDVKNLKEKHVVGDINSHFFDKNGEEVDHSINEYVIGLNIKNIKKIPNVLTVIYEDYKFPVLEVALENNFINLLVTTDKIANKLLDE